MATRAQASLLTNSSDNANVFGPKISLWIDAVRPSIALKEKHLSPNLAILVLAFRKANNVSGMELGTNRTRNGEVIVENGDDTIPVGNKSGWFSKIANVEQGGVKTDVPVGFLRFVSMALGVDYAIVEAANNEDHAIRVAYAAANRSK